MYIIHVCILPVERKKDKENLEYVKFIGKKHSLKIQKIQLLILLTIIQEIAKHMLIINYYMSEYSKDIFFSLLV